jgi:hypothetical protein
LLTGALILATGVVRGQPSAAIALDPIPAILEAFRTHDIVALSEGRHNNEPGYAFRLALIRDPRFPAFVNDIVVESGSSRYQDVMDRYVRGETVPRDTLRHAWQDTTQPDTAWDVPMYEEFFTAVRDLNAKLPPSRHLRVLLGEPPFDWDHATRDSWMRVGFERDSFPAALIQREVLAKGRHALVIYGNAHFLRRPTIGSSMVTRLDAVAPGRVFNVWTHTSGGDLQTLEPAARTWPIPSLVLTRNTALGAASFNFYQSGRGEAPRMEEEFDAVLYVGPPSGVTIRRGEITPSLCADADYMKMRLGRITLTDAPADAPLPPGVVRPADRLKQYCDTVTKQ